MLLGQHGFVLPVAGIRIYTVRIVGFVAFCFFEVGDRSGRFIAGTFITRNVDSFIGADRGRRLF